MKKLIKHTALFILLILGNNAWAQADAAKYNNDYMKDVAPEVVYIFMGVTILILLVTIALWATVKAVESKMFGTDEEKLLTEGQLTEEEAEVIKYQRRSVWERFFKAKPVVTDKDVVLDHDYDGIQELDNPAPPWFMMLFYGTIVFAVTYMLIYHVFMSAPLQTEEYEIEMAEAKIQVEEYLKLAADRVDENTVTLLTDKASILAGREVYVKNNCGQCHGEEGQGTQVPPSIGPNLTDNYWIHGGDVKNVFKTIKYGVIEKGMKAWGESLSPSEMQNVTAYIFAQQSKQLENAKEPQGELYNPEREVKSDSLTTDSLVTEDTELSLLK